VNLIDKEYKETFDYLGSHSKRDEDKLAKMNVKLIFVYKFSIGFKAGLF